MASAVPAHEAKNASSNAEQHPCARFGNRREGETCHESSGREQTGGVVCSSGYKGNGVAGPERCIQRPIGIARAEWGVIKHLDQEIPLCRVIRKRRGWYVDVVLLLLGLIKM